MVASSRVTSELAAAEVTADGTPATNGFADQGSWVCVVGGRGKEPQKQNTRQQKLFLVSTKKRSSEILTADAEIPAEILPQAAQN